MTRTTGFLWMVLAMIAVVPRAAWAVFVDAQYCVDFELDFTDGASGDSYTGTEEPARGVKLEFSATGTATMSHYTDSGGADPGCVDLSIDNQFSWTVKIVADASVNGNTLRVLDGIGGSPKKFTWLTGHTPVNLVGYQTDLGPSGTANVLGASGHAIHQHSGGLSGETFDFVLDWCNTPAESGNDLPGSCFKTGSEEIRISPHPDFLHKDLKYVILHEMGHAVTFFANGSNTAAKDTTADDDDCGPNYPPTSHWMPTKEFSSAAAVEGFGHFWAALAFNDDGTNADCEFESQYSPDWLHSGSAADAEDVDIFSCSGAIVFDGDTIVDEYDYYGQFCDGAGTQTNRSTEYDWLRALWDLRTRGALTAAQIYDIWDLADPDDWTENGAGSGGDFPDHRMQVGAFGLGGSVLESTWMTWSSLNGIDR